jgi:type I restriction enzyme S subunit
MYILQVTTHKYVKQGMGNPKLMSNVMSQIEIPLPPKPIQNEIVKILDSVSELVNSISEGLPAEIKARKQQYEYYRNKLLTFEERQ